MQVIEIADENILDLYCPFCGQHSLGKEGVKEPCSHLQWIDSSETLGESWYKSDAFPDLTDDLEDHDLREVLRRHFPDSSTIMFVLGNALPEDPEVYVIYQSAV